MLEPFPRDEDLIHQVAAAQPQTVQVTQDVFLRVWEGGRTE
jgi:hypothetical protein